MLLKFLRILSLLCCLYYSCACAMVAAQTTCPVDTWLINTRQVGCWNGTVQDPSALRYWQRDPVSGQWQSRTAAEWQASTTQVQPTWFMVHGNRYNPQDAVDYGWNFSQALIRQQPLTGPLRVVIWSWPSEQIHGAREDIQTKAARTATESILLAETLIRMPSETPVSFVAHSFGCRICTGTLHLLGRGTLSGYQIPATATPQQQLHAALSVSALHSTWLLPNSVHGKALDVTDRMLLVNNSCDPALRRYHFIDCTKPDAVGYSGAVLTAAQRAIVQQVDGCNCIGKSHSYNDLMRASSLMSNMRDALLTSSDN